MLTKEELCEKLLENYDADLLLELLQISSTDILDRFEDRIEIHWNTLEEALEDD